MRFEVDMAPLPYILHSAGTTVTDISPREKDPLATDVQRQWSDPRERAGGPARSARAGFAKCQMPFPKPATTSNRQPTSMTFFGQLAAGMIGGGEPTSRS
jgi:hypothetical protein